MADQANPVGFAATRCPRLPIKSTENHFQLTCLLLLRPGKRHELHVVPYVSYHTTKLEDCSASRSLVTRATAMTSGNISSE